MPYKNLEDRRNYMREYRKKNRDKLREQNAKAQRKYQQSTKGKITTEKYEQKRKAQRKYQQSTNRILFKKDPELLSKLSKLQNHCKDFSPNQNNLCNLSRKEKNSFMSVRVCAKPKALKNNKFSSRKGVSYNPYAHSWHAYLMNKGIKYQKYFKTKEEAITYRIYLEDTYYTSEQLAIRDKYKN